MINATEMSPKMHLTSWLIVYRSAAVMIYVNIFQGLETLILGP